MRDRGDGKLEIPPRGAPHLLSLSKVVLHAWTDGTCSLLTVPLSWHPEQPLPADVHEERYETPAAAMAALAEAGRAQNPAMRFHRGAPPELPVSPAETFEDQPSR